MVHTYVPYTETCPHLPIDTCPEILSIATILVETVCPGRTKPLKQDRVVPCKVEQDSEHFPLQEISLWNDTDKYPTLQFTSYV